MGLSSGPRCGSGSRNKSLLLQLKYPMRIFVEDHGKPSNGQGAIAELLLGSETGIRIAVLKGVDGNGLVGKSTAIKPGDRLCIRVTFGNGSVEVGEFAIR